MRVPATAPSADVTEEESADLERALARRVALGDATAFSRLYNRYAGEVYAHAAHLVGVSEAEEIVQDVFLRLWTAAAQFDPAKGTFGGWFMTIARRRVLDELRRRGRRTTLEAIERLLERDARESEDPAVEAEIRERRRLALAAVAKLPPEQRRVLLLSYFGGLSQSEIAQELGCSLGTVKKRIQLGLRKLRVSLGEQIHVEESTTEARVR